jgi:hypothetical protein
MNLALPLLGDYHAGCLRFLDDVEQAPGVDIGDLLEEPEGEAPTDHGAGREGPLRVLS